MVESAAEQWKQVLEARCGEHERSQHLAYEGIVKSWRLLVTLQDTFDYVEYFMELLRTRGGVVDAMHHSVYYVFAFPILVLLCSFAVGAFPLSFQSSMVHPTFVVCFVFGVLLVCSC